jgi:copper chaperone NosL
MKRPIAAWIVLAALVVGGCGEDKMAESPPEPRELTASAVGHYCGMNVLEHPGPKGQIILKSHPEPVWFSSARDAIAFTMLPEEPKDIRAVYVSDMAKAPSWEQPGSFTWIEARRAFFVVGSRMKGGMGAEEAVPFSDDAAAKTFAARNGGRVVVFHDIPRDYVLGTAAAGETQPSQPEAPGPAHTH